MREERVVQLLACLNSQLDPKSKRTGWVVATCPFAPWTHETGHDNHPSFGVNLPKGGKTQIYNCFSCGEAGGLDDLVFDVRDHYRKKKDVRYQIGKALEILVADDEEVVDFEVPEYDEPQENPDEVIFWPEHFVQSFKSVFAFEEALEYLKTREGDYAVWQKADLRFDSDRRRVCFPIRDFDGKLVGLHGRHIKDHPLPYYAYGFQDRRNKICWFGEHWLDLDRIVVLVESVFDAASVLRIYDNVICPLSAGFSKEKVRRIDGALGYITLFDNGTGGDRARERLSECLKSDFVHVKPPEGCKDPGEMSVDQLKKTLDKL